jgi:hypothetical protein
VYEQKAAIMVSDRIERRVEKRLRRRKHLFIHLALTLLFVLVATWFVDLFGAPRQIEDVIIPAAVLLFVARALWYIYQESGSFIIQQETERERYAEPDEKPKHQMAVGDDGELAEIAYDDDDWEEKLKRSE